MSDFTPYEGDDEDTIAGFQQSVRSVLLNLYDNAFLQNHPLTLAWAGDRRGDRLTHAQALRRALLDSIERLRPQSTAHGDAARAYAVLTYRCVDGLTIEAIEQKLGLSRRQTYREFNKGVEAVAAQLQDMLRSQVAAKQALAATTISKDTSSEDTSSEDTPHPSRQELAVAELARLSREARSEALDLIDVLKGVCQLLDSRLQQRCIGVDMGELKPAAPVLADRTLLRQALLNLLSYALDVLPDGSLLVLSVAESSTAVHLTLRQTNTSELAGRVAVPAQRREGVALTVAQSLILSQNGRLTLHDSPIAWSAEIVLPTAQTPTIVIIDDNQSLIELFHRYLAGHRVVVVGANSGDEAMALIRQLTPQAIVLDVMMPHQDGWEVLQRLRREPAAAAIPIIVCSVLREHDLALSLGASDTLVKPVSQPALLDAMRRWLGTLHPLE